MIVSVPGAVPVMNSSVLISMTPSTTSVAYISIPRGAGPERKSPARLKTDPWHGHSNWPDDSQNGTRHPRWEHTSERATTSPLTFVRYARAWVPREPSPRERRRPQWS